MTFLLNVTEVEPLAILESLQSYYNKEEKNQIDREFALKIGAANKFTIQN